MFVDYRGSILTILGWQWRAVVLFLASSTLIVVADKSFDLGVLHLPALPLGVVGGAIGIFASFRTNSAYDRWWEGRKLWGRMINVSRHFASQVLAYVGRRGESERADELVRRHVGYVHVLRCLLRQQKPLDDADVVAFLTVEEQAALVDESNMTHALLQTQLEILAELAEQGVLDERRLQSFDESIREILDVQGGCERIKKTPMPRGYGYFAERLIQLFGMLLPLGLVEPLGWLTIPVTLLVCMSFYLISEVGRVLEDPFTMFWPALPLYALSKTIEVNLRQRLGDTDLPALPKPVRGVLM